MKKLFLLSSIFAAAAVFATAAGAGGNGADHGSFAFDSTVFVPCANGGAGETVDVSGSLNFVFHSFFDSAGGQHLQLKSNLQGVSGIGLTTGTKYQMSDSETFVFNVAADDAPNETTTVSNMRVTGQGPGNNFLLHETAHFTINANGTVTAQHDNFSVDCK